MNQDEPNEPDIDWCLLSLRVGFTLLLIGLVSAWGAWGTARVDNRDHDQAGAGDAVEITSEPRRTRKAIPSATRKEVMAMDTELFSVDDVISIDKR
jgi:uncharacterized protein with beta-barrel porin domain